MPEDRWEDEVAVPLAVLIAVLLVGGLAALAQMGLTSTPVGLDETLDEFRQEHSSEEAEEPGADTPAPSPEPPPAPPQDEGTPEAVDAGPADQGAPPAGEASEQTSPPPVGDETTSPAPFSPPQRGVYRYAATGGEAVGAPGGDRAYPAESFATVRHRGGCEWEFEHRVARERVERRTYCSRSGEVTSLESETEVTFYGRTEHGRLTCDPPRVLLRHDDRRGVSRQTTCRSAEGDESSETISYRGTTTLQIGGASVSAHQVRIDAVFSGRASGESRVDIWLHPESGLPLRIERRVDSRSDMFGADLRYDEEATFELTELEPRT